MRDIVSLIEAEDKKRALTDDQIAEALGISRFDVIRLRKKHDIPDYRKRRLPFLSEDLQDLLAREPGLSDTALTRRVQALGYEVSRTLVAELRRELPETAVPPKLFEGGEIDDAAKAAFDSMMQRPDDVMGIIGTDGSIHKQVKQMKAALVYPPNGLHTLIVGETGTGKSLLAEASFNKAKEEGLIAPERKFIRLNCADYASNAELLASQLFGHVRGAFTGADSEKDGLVKQADGGVLFLDEIHRLSAQGQEMLFSIIDYGTYRKLGESRKVETVELMIIGATTEDVNPTLLGTFKRRIPMLIELPALRHRGIDERYTLTTRFLRREADRTRKTIRADSDCLAALLSYDCPGNIGQLLSDVRVSVAKAYLRTIEDDSAEITLELADLPHAVQGGLMRKKYTAGAAVYSEMGIRVSPGAPAVDALDLKQTRWNPANIYDFITSRYQYLMDQNVPLGAALDLIAKEIDYRVGKMMRLLSENERGAEGFALETGSAQINAVIDKMLAMAERRLGELRREVVLCLRMNICSLMQKVVAGHPFFDLEVEAIKQKYLFEYQLACELLAYVGAELGLAIPKEAIALTATYLRVNSGSVGREIRQVKVLVVTHGNVAREIANLVNIIAEEVVIDYLCLPLDRTGKQLAELAVEKAKTIEEEGILLLADMGSTLTLGEIIAGQTGKKTKTVGRVDAAIALEAAMKVKATDSTLDEVYDYVKDKSVATGRQRTLKTPKKGRVILTVCITGQGAAVGIKSLLEETLQELQDYRIDVIPIGVVNENTDSYIEKIARENELIAVVGSFRPEGSEAEFFSVESVIDADGVERLRRLINDKCSPKRREAARLGSFVHADTVLCHRQYADKEEALADLAGLLHRQGYVGEEYLENVLRRERAINTGFIGGIAIPHTYGKYVSRSAIAVATLATPLQWGEGYLCDLVLMLALRDEDTKVVRQLYRFADDVELTAGIRRAGNPQEVLTLLRGAAF